MILSPSSEILVKQSIHPQAVGTGATVNGTGIDCLGAESGLVEVNIGAVVDTTNISVTVKLQQSDDDGSSDAYADIDGATTGAILNAGQNEPYLFDLNLSELKRYIRAVATGGSAGGGLVGVSFKLSDLRSAPPTQVNTATRVGYS